MTKRKMRFTRRLAAVAAMIMMAACGDDPVSDTTGPEEPAPSGLFSLESMHGFQVPTYMTTPGVPGVDGHRTLYRWSTIEIIGDSVHYELDKSMEWPMFTFTDVFVSEAAELRKGPYGGFAIVQMGPGPGGQSVVTLHMPITTWGEDSLVVTGDSENMVYRRVGS